jgi:serine O-acetyltransferase
MYIDKANVKEQPDWTREKPRRFWDPSRKLLKTIRQYQKCAQSKNIFSRKLLIKWLVIKYRFWSVITGAEIDLRSKIGGGLLLPHPNGIVIHPNTIIGNNCLIFQQVTIGTNGNSPIPPTISDHVDIGAGAKILGNITIGYLAKIGANAVVTKNVPARSTAVGIPATIKMNKGAV